MTQQKRNIRTVRKPSAAAMKRELKQVLHARGSAPPPLTEPLERFLSSYRPQIEPDTWHACRPVVVEAARRYAPTGKDSLEKILYALSREAAWAAKNGIPLTLEELLSANRIEAFVNTGLPELNDGSRASVRSRLRRVAARLQVDPSFALPKAVLGHRDVAPPYTSAEISIILSLIKMQPPVARAKLAVAVALGLGAGISATDLRDLHKSHVIDHGGRGIEIRVPGTRPRTIWVLPAYEELLRAGIQTVKPTQHVLGRSAIAKNTISDLYAQATAADSRIDIAQGRLRNTWLAYLMTQPIPLSVLLPAAGLSSARTLTELLPFVLPDGEVDTQHSNQ